MGHIRFNIEQLRKSTAFMRGTQHIPPTEQEPINLWTTVGLNNQFTHAGAAQYPRNEYPICWYVGVDFGQVEDSFIKKLVKAIKGLGTQKAKSQVDESRFGHEFFGYFSSYDVFAKVVEDVVGHRALEVAQPVTGDTKTMTAEELLKKGKTAEQNYVKRYLR